MSKDITSISMNDPFIKRYFAWSGERFPMANVISGIITYIVMSRIALFLNDQSLDFSLIDILGSVAVIGHYFILRVFDEHKDFEIDCINHPERALQRGLISLKHLDIGAILFTIIAVVFSLMISNNYLTLICYGVVYLWSTLMAKEFFVGSWLEKRITLYSFSHMLVSPIIITWIMSSKWQTTQFDFNTYTILLMSLASGFSYEITRKTRGPEEETETLDSYTKVYGVGGSVLIISVMNMITLATFLLFSAVIPVYRPFTIALATIGFVLAQVTLIKFVSTPSLKARKNNEASFGIYALMLYSALLVGIYAN